MNENLKNLLEKVSSDEALRTKFEPLTKMEDKSAAAEAILALAAEAGMPLTAADLEPEEELDLDELDTVSGGRVVWEDGRWVELIYRCGSMGPSLGQAHTEREWQRIDFY